MDTQKLFGKRVKELRKQANLTQEQLAEKLGVFPKQIGNIETGTTFTTMTNLEKLAGILNVEIQDLFNFNHQKPIDILKTEIFNIVSNANNNQIVLIHRILKDITK